MNLSVCLYLPSLLGPSQELEPNESWPSRQGCPLQDVPCGKR